MSGLDVRLAKVRASCHRLAPPTPARPMRVGTVATHATSGIERAAAIAREDAARAGRMPHVLLGQLGTSVALRARAVPPLVDFATGDDAPGDSRASRRPVDGKNPP